MCKRLQAPLGFDSNIPACLEWFCLEEDVDEVDESKRRDGSGHGGDGFPEPFVDAEYLNEHDGNGDSGDGVGENIDRHGAPLPLGHCDDFLQGHCIHGVAKAGDAGQSQKGLEQGVAGQGEEHDPVIQGNPVSAFEPYVEAQVDG